MSEPKMTEWMWEATTNIYVTLCYVTFIYAFEFDYFLFTCSVFRCVFFFVCSFVFFICAYFFSSFSSFFKWENKWIIISRPPERPISFALGSDVHFTVCTNILWGLKHSLCVRGFFSSYYCCCCCVFLCFIHLFGFVLFFL